MDGQPRFHDPRLAMDLVAAPHDRPRAAFLPPFLFISRKNPASPRTAPARLLSCRSRPQRMSVLRATSRAISTAEPLPGTRLSRGALRDLRRRATKYRSPNAVDENDQARGAAPPTL